MATTTTTVETQRVYVVENSLTFLIPASYDTEWNELEVFAAIDGSDRGVPVAFTINEDKNTVLVEADLRSGDVVVVRVRPQKSPRFTKQTRQSLTSGQVNDLYEHTLASASAADDKILSQYGIVITGNVPPEDIARVEDLDAVEDKADANTVTSVDHESRIVALEQGGTGYEGYVPATEGETQAGTANDLLITPWSNRVGDEYFDVKAMHIVALNTQETLEGSFTGLYNELLPNFLAGMYIKDLQVSTTYNSSTGGPLTVTVRQDAVILASAELPEDVLYVDKDSVGVAISPIELLKGSLFAVDVNNAGREIKGLTLTITFGWETSRAD